MIKCAHCGIEITEEDYVFVYADEDIIHQDCFDDWAFNKLSGDLEDMPGKRALRKFREGATT